MTVLENAYARDNDALDELGTDLVAEPFEAAQVARSDGRGRLHLDADDATVGRFDDDVDLRELLRPLIHHERLEQSTGVCRCCSRISGRVLINTDKVRGQTAVGHVQLRPRIERAAVARPSRHAVEGEDDSQQPRRFPCLTYSRQLLGEPTPCTPAA